MNPPSPKTCPTPRQHEVAFLWEDLACCYLFKARIISELPEGNASGFQHIDMTCEIRSDLLLCFKESSKNLSFGPQSLQGCSVLSCPNGDGRALQISFRGQVAQKHLTLELGSSEDLAKVIQACNKVSRPVQLTEFDPAACIGRGRWGKVSVCRRGADQHGLGLFAVKEISLRNRRTVKLVKNERLVMASLGQHPFVVRLHFAIKQGGHVYLIMDFAAGGDLYSLLRKHCVHRSRDVLFYALEVALALEHCHGARVAHRDLKPENVLVAPDGHVRLGDFGLARRLPRGCSGARTVCGTEVYAAPEMLRRAAPYGYSVDYWQFGNFLFELFCGHPPFYSEEGHHRRTRESILGGSYTIPEHVPDAPRDMIARLLAPEPSERLGCLPDALRSDRPGEGWRAIRDHPVFRSLPWDAASQRKRRPPVVNVAPGVDVLENFEDQFILEDAGFGCDSGAVTPCDAELLGFYYDDSVL